MYHAAAGVRLADGDTLMGDATAEPELAGEPASPVSSAAAAAADASLLDAIVGGELGQLDPVFHDTVPAQVAYNTP